VVLLDDAVAKHPSILRLNPNRDPLKPCVYVGMTGLPVNHRFENHKNHYKAAWVARKHPNLKPYGNGVLLWFEIEDFDAAVARAKVLDRLSLD